MSDCGGQAPALRWPGRRASLTVARGPVPRNASQKPRGILRSYRTLSSCSCCASIDIQVLSDLAFILFILRILAILLQTLRRHGGGQAPARRKKTHPRPP